MIVQLKKAFLVSSLIVEPLLYNCYLSCGGELVTDPVQENEENL
jgi:hypothetical protein